MLALKPTVFATLPCFSSKVAKEFAPSSQAAPMCHRSKVVCLARQPCALATLSAKLTASGGRAFRKKPPRITARSARKTIVRATCACNLSGSRWVATYAVTGTSI